VFTAVKSVTAPLAGQTAHGSSLDFVNVDDVAVVHEVPGTDPPSRDARLATEPTAPAGEQVYRGLGGGWNVTGWPPSDWKSTSVPLSSNRTRMNMLVEGGVRLPRRTLVAFGFVQGGTSRSGRAPDRCLTAGREPAFNSNSRATFGRNSQAISPKVPCPATPLGSSFTAERQGKPPVRGGRKATGLVEFAGPPNQH
jgi:hypothetical protein